jgi:hypothetical protein
MCVTSTSALSTSWLGMATGRVDQKPDPPQKATGWKMTPAPGGFLGGFQVPAGFDRKVKNSIK